MEELKTLEVVLDWEDKACECRLEPLLLFMVEPKAAAHGWVGLEKEVLDFSFGYFDFGVFMAERKEITSLWPIFWLSLERACLVCFKGGFGRDRNKLLQLSLLLFFPSLDLQGTNFNSMIYREPTSTFWSCWFLMLVLKTSWISLFQHSFQNGLEIKKTNMGCWIMKEVILTINLGSFGLDSWGVEGIGEFRRWFLQMVLKKREWDGTVFVDFPSTM